MQQNHPSLPSGSASWLEQPLLLKEQPWRLPHRALRLGAAGLTLLLGLHTASQRTLWSGTQTFAEARRLRLRVDGVLVEHTVVALNSTPSSLFDVRGGTIRLGRGGSASQGTRLWVAHDTSLLPESYVNFELLGRRLSYTIDLSDVGCSCNAALFWVSMPGYGPDGKPAPGAFGNYYCGLRL